MSEDDVRSGLREAVADEPRLDFDPDALIASARRQVTRRRSLLAGAATVVVVAAVAVPIALSRDQGPPVTTTVADRPSSFQWPPSDVKPVWYTEKQLHIRGAAMREHLARVVPRVLRGATEFEFGEFGGEAEGQFHDGQDSVNTHVSFTVDGARYSLYVEVRAPGSAEPPECGGDPYCGQVAVRGGGPLLSTFTDLGKETIATVRHYRPDGAVVGFSAYNYDLAARTPPTHQPTIPVTTDQLVTLASDPELGL